MTEISIKDGDQFKDKQGRIWTAEWRNYECETTRTLTMVWGKQILTLGAFQHALDAHNLERYENQTNG